MVGAGRVWVKHRTGDEPGDLAALGGRALDHDVHPTPGLDPAGSTVQRGVPGRWFERLPHFSAEGAPSSSGAELQSEWYVDRVHGPCRGAGPARRRGRAASGAAGGRAAHRRRRRPVAQPRRRRRGARPARHLVARARRRRPRDRGRRGGARAVRPAPALGQGVRPRSRPRSRAASLAGATSSPSWPISTRTASSPTTSRTRTCSPEACGRAEDATAVTLRRRPVTLRRRPAPVTPCTRLISQVPGRDDRHPPLCLPRPSRPDPVTARRAAVTHAS